VRPQFPHGGLGEMLLGKTGVQRLMMSQLPG
jgi:hypothetical protein